MNRRRNRAWLVLLLLLAPFAGAGPVDPPLSIEALRHQAFDPTLRYERELRPGPGFNAYLVSYQSSGLKVYAMVAVPVTPRPRSGHPVLIANHGFHPQPRRYGITEDGIDWRPGDYYRAVPAAYAEAGFLVVMPDYRGHNDSEGFEYTQTLLASHYYSADVLVLLAGVGQIEHADPNNVFMWGHSLGGEVSLRALLATDRIKGASLWAPVSATLREQAEHYPRQESVPDAGSGALRLKRDLDALPRPFDLDSAEPLRHLERLSTPLLLHHARGDRSVPYSWSERLTGALERCQKRFFLYPYDGDRHMFGGDQMRTAVARDTAFFRSLMRVGER